jgi:COMPASS component SWD3
MASGGWDRSVYFWDLRVKTSIRQVFGYYIGGEAIDFKGHQVLLGDNKPEHPLRIYDTKADKMMTIPWTLTS